MTATGYTAGLATAASVTAEAIARAAADALLLVKPTFATLTGDVSNTTTAQADATGLGFTVAAGPYEFEYVLPYTGSVNGASGIVCQLTGPATSYLMYVIEIQNANSAFSSLTKTTLSSTAPASTANITTAGTLYMCRMRGKATFSAGGTLIPQFAANVGSTTTTIKAGAYGRLQAL